MKSGSSRQVGRAGHPHDGAKVGRARASWAAVLLLALGLSAWAGGCGDDGSGTAAGTQPAGETVEGEGAGEVAVLPEAGLPIDPETGLPIEGGQPAGTPGQRSEQLAYPTGNVATSTLTVERVTPEKISAGQAFTYQLKLTNLTDQPMTGVRVRETVPASLEIRSTDPAVQQPSPQQGGQQPQQPPGAGADTRVLAWSIDLPPKESRTISIQAVADQPGRLERSLAVDAAGAAGLAGGADVAAPEIVLVKDGPARVELGEPITYKYTVTNNSAGDTGALTISDGLPPGLTTENGQGTVGFELGSLPKGQSREFVVKLKAAQPGEYAGRATAKGAAFGEVGSRRLVTVVAAPKLAAEVRAPAWEEVGRPVTFTVVVRNEGDAPARDVTLAFNTTGVQGARLVTGADLDQPVNPPAQGQQDPQNAMGSAVQPVGTIEPGASRSTTFTVRTTQKGNLTADATATAKQGAAQQGAQGQQSQQQTPPPMFTAKAQAQTTIVGVPALTLEVYDQEDPVQPDAEINYRLTLQNHGTANDRDVAVTVTLPDGVTLAENGAQGPTPAKAEGQRLSFAPLPTVGPGQSQQWTIKAKAGPQPGQKRIRVEARSGGMLAPLIATETTRVIEPPPPPPAPAPTPAAPAPAATGPAS